MADYTICPQVAPQRRPILHGGRGGWSYKIFFVSILIALIIYAVYYCISFAVEGLKPIHNQFTTASLILLIII